MSNNSPVSELNEFDLWLKFKPPLKFFKSGLSSGETHV